MSFFVVGLDIGGANLKAAHSSGPAVLRPFELWRRPTSLADALSDVLQAMPPFDRLAVTMTGELCDCFESKRQGVHVILDAVEAARGAVPGSITVRVWQNDGQLVDLATARNQPLQAAAANWLALATYAGRFAPTGKAVVIDVGSTTTDIIPLHDGRPVPHGRTDPERLRSRELVYTGARRTPLCALLDPPAAAEFFATTLDAYLVLGMLPENEADRQTADGRPATRLAAEARLARMLCADAETSSGDEIQQVALQAHIRQLDLLRGALDTVAARTPGPVEAIILSGSGEFLARALVENGSPSRVISLEQTLGPEASKAACAYALAVLAMEQGFSEPET